MKIDYFLKSVAALAVSGAFFLQAHAQDAPAPKTVVEGITYQLVTPDEGDPYAETVRAQSTDGSAINYDLATIVIQAEVTIDGTKYPVKKIGDSSMRQNNSLTSITIPEGVEIIGNSAFAGCEKLPEIKLPSTVTSIEAWAFENTKSFTSVPGSVTLPKAMTEIPGSLFRGSGIKSFDLSGTDIVKIGDAAFLGCPNLETLILGEKTKEIGSAWVFQNCTKLTTVDLKSVEMIGTGAFAGCTGLTSITLPNTIFTIAGWAFEKAINIKEVYASWEDPAGQNDIDAAIFLDGAAFGQKRTDEETGAPIDPVFTWKIPKNLKDVYDPIISVAAAPYPLEGLFSVEKGYAVEYYDSGEEPPTAIELVETEKINVFYANGSLNLKGLDGYSASVFALDGRIVANFQIVGENAIVPAQLTKGIYVISAAKGANKAAAKFVVR